MERSPVTGRISPSTSAFGGGGGSGSRYAAPSRSAASNLQPNYSSLAVQKALEHLASIDLIELCSEAKVERCRATRDLRSCGRYVQHVLDSCGHASLCKECSQRCDSCPICRIPIPKNGNRLRPRLYCECIEAGLISKRCDERFQEKEDGDDQLTADVLRLYSLFDVAMENSLVSLICHYNAGTEEMGKRISLLLKVSNHLGGISNVLEVLESSFRGSSSAQVNDLQFLHESVLKAKQHADIMAWCIRNEFLENLRPRYGTLGPWRSDVRARKAAAVKRSWPDVVNQSAGSNVQAGSLFIEDALSNLEIDLGHPQDMEAEFGLASLQKDSDSLFRSKLEGLAGCYPFESLRVAVDTLFLTGSSDMVVAKQAIEACNLLPEICGASTHPKIAQVLLERGVPETALMVLRWSGHDGSQLVSFSEAVTAVRVRVECGLLTEAFMYQRNVWTKVKEKNSKGGQPKVTPDDFSEWLETLVTEICCLCIKRNMVDRMIELPWDASEEKHLSKCLLDCAVHDPSSTTGNLLVVYYLQRYRYTEAYDVDAKLQNVEQDFISKNPINEAGVSRMRSASHWRAALVVSLM
ncbi:E3 ubiquitin-protein ligase HOS1 [Linum grandiflorum]